MAQDVWQTVECRRLVGGVTVNKDERVQCCG